MLRRNPHLQSARPEPLAIIGKMTAAASIEAAVCHPCLELLRPLMRADHERGGDLAATLRAYYASGASVAKTAEAMFLHRNSVRYRLDRVRILLRLDIDHPYSIAALIVAFAINDVTQKTKEADAVKRAQ